MAQYVVGLDSSLKRIFVWKTTGDPTVLTNWSAQDRGLTTNPGEIKSIWAVLDGTDIHIAISKISSLTNSTSPASLSQYCVFDTSTDTWSTELEGINITAHSGNTSERMAVSIVVRSDGDVVALHGAFGTAYYSIRESGSWGARISAFGGSSTPRAGIAVLGASDRTHFFSYDDTNDTIDHRSLSSANALDTQSEVDAAVGTSVQHPLGRGISYPDNGNTTIKVPYLDADESITSIRIDASGANPTIATDTAASDNDAEDINSSVIACMAIDSTNTWLLYSGSGSTGLQLLLARRTLLLLDRRRSPEQVLPQQNPSEPRSSFYTCCQAQ
jgi:hypothetical protein